MTGSETLPPAIAHFFDATNHADRERFLSAFAADAVLDDWGHTYTGRDEVARWNETDNMGVQSHFEVTGFTVHNGIYAVSIQVTGNGFNGGGTMAFTIVDDLISRVDITG
ncbi:MAG: nuclear transport factor 2 family protein [Herbiconiux sp.]|uniref:nuclear transport factor 2 family protein n=1 Tax=Herbiconiux sp. TaxID=1871186 RepID=UPI001225824E|nr:nuclear transport factor 2 family protein [Herbiconiux sp.]TAJ46789.1 MAG: nuclear transport factor 2 family protein [Herbiconiux sp.]